jgi:hypothetical protein
MKLLPFALAALAALPLAAQQDSVLLRALDDELSRSKMLRIASLDPPYFIAYSLEDADVFDASATLGGLLGSSHRPLRALETTVRVGSYQFDNTNYVFSSLGRGSIATLPVENSYPAIRQTLWLDTDSSFKAAEEAIARKRAALKNMNVPDALPDFSKAPPVQALLPAPRQPIDPNAWTDRVVRLSRVFLSHPRIISSLVSFESIQAASYLVNSEGTRLRQPNDLAYLTVRAQAQAPDGMMLHDSQVFPALEFTALPPESDIQAAIERLASNLDQLTQAPRGEDYSGPVLFEPLASAQLFAQVLGNNLKLTRKPVPQPGRPAPYIPSELEGRLGSRILPASFDVVDDPEQAVWQGRSLAGTYAYDDEGVKAGPLNVVSQGVLKNFLLTRTPVAKGLETSNGRARLHGSFGAAAPGYGNLFVHSSNIVASSELKQRLIQLCKERNKPYGILIRQLDFPSSASLDELRRLLAAMQQDGSGNHFVSPPILAYRVYPDGREELVRGLRFRDVSVRSLKDILAASNENVVFNFLDNTAPLAILGGANYITAATVVAPGVLFDELDLEATQDEVPKLPLVPPPPLEASK